jgi:hypothetical protein
MVIEPISSIDIKYYGELEHSSLKVLVICSIRLNFPRRGSIALSRSHKSAFGVISIPQLICRTGLILQSRAGESVTNCPPLVSACATGDGGGHKKTASLFAGGSPRWIRAAHLVVRPLGRCVRGAHKLASGAAPHKKHQRGRVAWARWVMGSQFVSLALGAGAGLRGEAMHAKGRGCSARRCARHRFYGVCKEALAVQRQHPNWIPQPRKSDFRDTRIPPPR